jgi:hypothetical protein
MHKRKKYMPRRKERFFTLGFDEPPLSPPDIIIT